MHFVKAKTLLNNRNGMNIYRGCSHGCVYCDSRSTCYQFTHAFEDIEVKENAPQLLETALRSRRRKCMIGTGSMSDPYMHCEAKLGMTRACLEIIHRYGFGVTVLTKSDLILRDIDLLASIHENAKCVVQMTLTVWDETLSALLEPNVCNTRRRVEVLKEMQKRGIPTIVWLTPVLPFLTDTEENIRSILTACAEAGVKGILCFDMGLTLREGDREYYYAALDRHFPGLSRRYMETYGNAYELPSPDSRKLMGLLQEFCYSHAMYCTPEECFDYLAEFPQPYEQLALF